MPRPTKAIVFDLYDTLVRIGRPTIHRKIPRLLGCPVRPWMQLVRDDLMRRPFDTTEAFVRHIAETLVPERTAEQEQRCVEVVDAELASVEPMPGVHSLLSFLKRRGYRLGLLSNLTSVHKEPLSRFKLDDAFTAMGFSCDTGRLKPEPEAYHEVLAALEVEPEDVLFVGDSERNDVKAPRQLGMRAIRVCPGEAGALQAIAQLGWVSADDPQVPLLPVDRPFRLGGREGHLGATCPLGDDEQGRMNLVAVGEFSMDDGTSETVFCKRFQHAAAAQVEVFMYGLMHDLGFPSCDATVVDDDEGISIVTRAPGKKFSGPVDPVLAHELGRQCAAGYLFSNADLRPRNALLHHDEDGKPVVTMLDLEHCLFNLALDIEGLDDPFDPATFDRLSTEEIERRTKRRVLTHRTTRRAMGTFIQLESVNTDRAVAFRDGWVNAFHEVAARADEICEKIEARVHRRPYLIIGTSAYRRAMAQADVDDIRERLKQDPSELFGHLAALKRPSRATA